MPSALCPHPRRLHVQRRPVGGGVARQHGQVVLCQLVEVDYRGDPRAAVRTVVAERRGMARPIADDEPHGGRILHVPRDAVIAFYHEVDPMVRTRRAPRHDLDQDAEPSSLDVREIVVPILPVVLRHAKKSHAVNVQLGEVEMDTHPLQNGIESSLGQRMEGIFVGHLVRRVEPVCVAVPSGHFLRERFLHLTRKLPHLRPSLRLVRRREFVPLHAVGLEPGPVRTL
mmetsp:Transcript_28332/g.60390  ORF Transcript_28332/g.60390 Transcript_28332/m.60390 type:complete len:227 (+) Transcript_28332:274-954(+)